MLIVRMDARPGGWFDSEPPWMASEGRDREQ